MDNQHAVSTAESIHLAIDPNRLEVLIREGRIKITDFSCLDTSSKRGVWAMIRSLAASRMQQ